MGEGKENGLLHRMSHQRTLRLHTEDVLIPQMAFRIPDGKTENARRIIPVHRYGWPIIKRRLMSTSDEWLFPGLTPAGPDAKRSWIVVKRFATFRQEVLGKDKSVDFNSLRRTFATYLERASTQTLAVNTSTIAELMGHVKPTLALAVYSSGLVPAQLRAAIDALDLVLEPEVIALLQDRAPLLSDPKSV
jgi:integrase